MVEITVANVEQYRGNLTLKPGDLGVNVNAIFDLDNCFEWQMVMIEQVISIKNQLEDPFFKSGEKPDPRHTAFQRMLDAASNLISKRAPLQTMRRETDGKLLVVDGNATVQVLMLVGWEEVPVQIKNR